ncbi:MAG: hypothetical protein IH623_13880 [Verrucomicrobia bacterium]|nr:hypothetical protein [Verrucomicrobiota bacterium]
MMSKSVPGFGNAGPQEILLRWLLGLSLLLNVSLATWLYRPSPGIISQETATTSARQSAAVAVSLESGSSPAARRPGSSAPPFDWREIESADYRQYMANLRAIGCPEQTIRDILLADLNQLFGMRAQAILPSPTAREFWQKPKARENADVNQLEQLKALHDQKQAAIKQLFGVRLEGQEMFNTLSMQPDTARTGLAFLSEDKREAAYRTLCEANLAYISLREATQSDRQRQAEVLAGILSPDELVEFQMRTHPERSLLSSELQYFDSTPEEYRTLVKLRQEMRGAANASNDPYIRMAEEAAAFGQVFGEARAQEYAQKADSFYLWARRAAERYGLAEDAPSRAWEVKSQAITTLQQIRADTSLTVEERRRLVEALHQTTEARLVEVLGPKGLAMAKLGDVWLQFPTLETSR